MVEEGVTVDWLNLHYSVLDSEAVVGSEPIDRATWLFLLRYCMGQENGGVIAGASEWGDRRWQQICRITQAEVMRRTSLWSWVGNDLHVHAYPIEKEAEVKHNRTNGRQGGLARTPNKAAAARANGAKRKPSGSQAPTQAESQRKGREGKGMEGGSATTTTIPFTRGKIDTSRLLGEHGIPNAPQAVAEWKGGLSRVARCKSEAEARAFLRWASDVCRMQGVTVEHWRHVRLLALEWDGGKRDAVMGATA